MLLRCICHMKKKKIKILYKINSVRLGVCLPLSLLFDPDFFFLQNSHSHFFSFIDGVDDTGWEQTIILMSSFMQITFLHRIRIFHQNIYFRSLSSIVCVYISFFSWCCCCPRLLFRLLRRCRPFSLCMSCWHWQFSTLFIPLRAHTDVAHFILYVFSFLISFLQSSFCFPQLFKLSLSHGPCLTAEWKKSYSIYWNIYTNINQIALIWS